MLLISTVLISLSLGSDVVARRLFTTEEGPLMRRRAPHIHMVNRPTIYSVDLECIPDPGVPAPVSPRDAPSTPCEWQLGGLSKWCKDERYTEAHHEPCTKYAEWQCPADYCIRGPPTPLPEWDFCLTKGCWLAEHQLGTICRSCLTENFTTWHNDVTEVKKRRAAGYHKSQLCQIYIVADHGTTVCNNPVVAQVGEKAAALQAAQEKPEEFKFSDFRARIEAELGLTNLQDDLQQAAQTAQATMANMLSSALASFTPAQLEQMKAQQQG